MKISFTKSKPKADLEIIILKDCKLPRDLNAAEKAEIALKDYKGDGLLHCASSSRLFVGFKKLDYDFPNEILDALASAFRAAFALKIKSISIKADSISSISQIAISAELCAYTFQSYKSEPKKLSIESILIYGEIDPKKAQEEIKKAQIIATATNKSRELVNTPPMDATPKYIAEYAKKLAKELNLQCEVFGQKELQKQKCGLFLAVGRASVNEPFLVHLVYRPADSAESKNTKAKSAKKLPRFVFVGKGLTYDTGGLSLKPSDYMCTMKCDKSGACAVLGIIEAAAKLKLNAEIHGILGLAENAIGGDAYRPDDILKARNGKSVEIKNTDAEGRLVLADCLDFASELEPDFLVDMATLTGACSVGVGEYTSGIMGFNSSLRADFCKAALKSGELVAELPFNPYLRKLLNSENADICHIASGRQGGALTAGLFLSEFVRKDILQKWVHMDMAGPAFVEKVWSVNNFGATGAGVRACVSFIFDKLK